MNGRGLRMQNQHSLGRMLPSIAAVAAGLVVASCAGEGLGEPRYATDQCRRVALEDADTKSLVVGAEDFALDRNAGQLFISAYDRRAAEKAEKAAKMKSRAVVCIQ